MASLTLRVWYAGTIRTGVADRALTFAVIDDRSPMKTSQSQPPTMVRTNNARIDAT
jgi:hypothetical protein